ncbi:Lysophospholipase L1-like esterase [Frankia sp. AiPs1]|uniref:SGNH/GDSL hydrolase family protein n=1 Tax=Frankia sp. AiPa1 TaxID=573492 RepID=UPI00202B8316|nr:SGNH/GDSL hydrolase family protein [Frankia sp. AiPa1]MCL9760790.1 SGNH/GDSL hydrolase family protein [Frankia sp. AiPa1]
MTPRTTAARFVALGDSITVGLGDGVTMGREHRGAAPAPTRGFAARFADLLGASGAVDYTNLATTGATARDVRLRQLPAALALSPQLATVVAGMNDILKPAFDPLRLRQDLIWTVSRLRVEGVTVLTATMPDPGRLLRLPAPLARLLADRVGQLNAAVYAAARHDTGVLVVDLGHHPAVRRRSSFDVDRVHPGPYGHQLIAQAFAQRLAQSGVLLGGTRATGATGGPSRFAALAPLEAGTTGAADITAPGAVRHAYWLVRVGMPWLVGRCLPAEHRPPAHTPAPHEPPLHAPAEEEPAPVAQALKLLRRQTPRRRQTPLWSVMRREILARSDPRRA